METVIITGGTGMIGTVLAPLLISKGYRVVILTRKAKSSSTDNLIYSAWDPSAHEMDKEIIATADHIIHLAGANVGEKRWTTKRKKEIVESRVKGGETIVKALAAHPNKVKTVVGASGIGWYGPDKKNATRGFIETDPHAGDFLGETCAQWEESIRGVTALGKRLVTIRTGMVLSNEGGAFREFVKPMKTGVAPILGSGKQNISWIHIDDICRVYLHAIENKSMNGVYNAAAPEVVTNKTLVLKAAKRRRRPFIPMHVPAFVLRIYLGEMSVEVLKSAAVDDSRLRSSGFHFLFPGLDAALGELLGK